MGSYFLRNHSWIWSASRIYDMSVFYWQCQSPNYGCTFWFSTSKGLPIVWFVFRVRALSLDCFRSVALCTRLHRPPACNSYSHQALSNSLSAEQTLSAELQRQSARWKAEPKHQQRHHSAHLIIARAKKRQTVCLSWERILHGPFGRPCLLFAPRPCPYPKGWTSFYSKAWPFFYTIHSLQKSELNLENCLLLLDHTSQ